MIKVSYSSKFRKAFRRLPARTQVAVADKEKLFKQDQFYPSLKTHPLKGELKGLFSFSVNYQYRVLFRFKDSQSVVFINIGTHSIYK